MTSRQILAALSLTLALSACADAPWVDTRREAGSFEPVGESTLDRVAICHTGDASRQELEKLALRECAKTSRTPVYLATDRFQCRLITPHRSYFDCR